MEALLLLLLPVLFCLAMPTIIGAAVWIWAKLRRDRGGQAHVTAVSENG